MNFETLGLSEQLLRATADMGYTEPTPIQAQSIPAVLKGGDILAAAQTGTGKTASFVLPILHRLSDKPAVKNNQVRALVLTPTRELAAQIQQSVVDYGKHLNLRSTVVFGGVKINPQMMKLRGGVDVLVATPGRLLDLYRQNAVKFDQVETLVLDEADRMLDMGFINDIKKILTALPKQRQNLLFSATFSNDIRRLAGGLLHDPLEINVAPKNTAAETVEQKVYPVDKARKAELLSHLIRSEGWHQALVFSRTKHGANKLVKLLDRDDIRAAAIHGNKSQSQRTKALADFKRGKVQVLVATDIASRGIDIDQLPQVVNFDLPNVPEDYVHRIGRTGRAGHEGRAISLVSADEISLLHDIERVINSNIERQEIEDFEPNHTLPASRPPGSGRGRQGQNRPPRKNGAQQKPWSGAKSGGGRSSNGGAGGGGRNAGGASRNTGGANRNTGGGSRTGGGRGTSGNTHDAENFGNR
ncbi:MAG: DEAD/DEAH box helicase [Porticoccaceae bacterium]